MPYHTNRHWQITDAPADARAFARKLAGSSWTLCTGFRFGEYLLLNDATGEDGAQEFAVVHEETLVQVESLTVGWMNEARLFEFLADLKIGAVELVRMGTMRRDRIETPDEHGTCPHCA